VSRRPSPVRVLQLIGNRYVWLRVQRLRSKTAVPGQVLSTEYGKRFLVIANRGNLYLASLTALGDKGGKHHHRFRLAFHSGSEATYRCRCGAEKERSLTPTEKKRHKKNFWSADDDKIHKLWHGIQRRIGKKFPVLKDQRSFCNWPVRGWDMEQFLEREAKRHPQHVLAAHTDDEMFMNSAIYFIAHGSPLRMKRGSLDDQPPEPHGGWMGATFIYCPQGGQPAVGFLYPSHVDSLLAALRKLKKLERKYGRKGGR